MLTYSITDIKKFMNLLLKEQAFDGLLLREAKLTTSSYYEIDGSLQREFFDTEELAALPSTKYISWAVQKPILFAMMKGRHLPLRFRIVLALPDSGIEQLLTKADCSIPASQVTGLFLNIIYENHELMLTTGTSLSIFTMDKSVDELWEGYIREFLGRHEL